MDQKVGFDVQVDYIENSKLNNPHISLDHVTNSSENGVCMTKIKIVCFFFRVQTNFA